MANFLLKEISSSNIIQELNQTGFDSAYLYKACDKFSHKNIKIFGLSLGQANILKQTALIFGADCAVNRNVITGKVEKSDVILCGSTSQLKKIAAKIKTQPFKLALLSEEILKFLELNKTRRTKLVGILNITPDSFSDGGKYYEPVSAQQHLISLIEDGADIIDIGAESTRPYSEPVSSEEQIKRLLPILSFIQKENIKIPVSIDTRSSEVADFVLNNGASIINDVSGFDYDPKIADIVSKYNAGMIIQHSKGKPEDMQNAPSYINVVEEIFLSLKKKAELAENKGIRNIIIDPGIGFGKTCEDNFIILDRIHELYSLGYPVMAGVSRKSLLGIKNQDNSLKDALSSALAYPLIRTGIDFLRVHNVRLHREIINMVQNSIPT